MVSSDHVLIEPEALENKAFDASCRNPADTGGPLEAERGGFCLEAFITSFTDGSYCGNPHS